jgi:hypothetical protein
MTEVIGTLQAGSLSWSLTKMIEGDVLLEPDKGEWSRKHYARSIATAMKHEKGAKYEMALCLGLEHDGSALPFRFYKITRVKSRGQSLSSRA